MDMEEYMRRHINWSRKTFGSGDKTIGITKHIEKECAEIRESPSDLTEWVDVIILAMDGYWRSGGEASALMNDLIRKQATNMTRKWPPPVDGEIGEPAEHIKD